MNILVAMEFSGIMRDAFIERGHNAVSCDLLPTERPGPHIQDNVFNILHLKWDMMIAHYPCTFLCNSGVRWLYEEEGRWEKMEYAAKEFKSLLECPINQIAIENPIMHKYAASIIGRRADQFIHPWQHGHGETKATGLHLVNLPLIVPTNIVGGRKPVVFHESPGPDRWKERSRTRPGIAAAFAQQWG